jgi:endonuclease/exonuclease/phosphatase family metal-dependent hydrolase
MQFLRRLTKRFLVYTHIVVVVLYLIGCITPFLHPSRWWFVGFMGLIFPFLLLLLFLFLIFWLAVKKKWFFLSLAALLTGWKNNAALLGIHFTATEFKKDKPDNQLRVMTWNVRRFVPYYAEVFDPGVNINEQAILDEIQLHNPDVICFQEFYTSTNRRAANNIEIFKKELGYPYHVFSNDYTQRKEFHSGTAIFSKYPVVASAITKYPDVKPKTVESLVTADVLFKNDTIRFFSSHLQSFGFLRKDYTDLRKIKDQEDSGLVASKSIFRKMRQAFSLRGKQADFIRKKIDESPFPVIVCGDLNDVPNSYTYFKVKGNLKDAFLQKNWGLGKTFASGSSRVLSYLPTLRIDYIFADPALSVKQFRRITRRLSDHMGLVADIELISVNGK